MTQCVGQSPEDRWPIGPKAWPIPVKWKHIQTNPKAEHTRTTQASKNRHKITPTLGYSRHVDIATHLAEDNKQSADVKTR